MRLIRSLLLAAPLASGATAINKTDDQVNADIDYGSFANPSAYVRPFFRYWVPDASVALDTIAQDFAIVKEVGMGGMELLGFYQYGGTQSTAQSYFPTDWTVYGWGLEAWKRLMRVALQATKANGLMMDYALGPNQGSGVPARVDSEGLMMDLAPYNVSISIGRSFDDVLPGWGTGKLVSASTGLVVEKRAANLSASPGFIGPVYYNGTMQILAADSLMEVTDRVGKDGHLKISLPANVTGVEYRLFAYYQVFSQYREQASPEQIVEIPQSPVTNYTQNGSWVPDHFSAAGAQVMIDFWDQHLLDDDIRQLLHEVGNYAWEDSQEFGGGVAVWWTPKMLDVFAADMGYNFAKYLPLLFAHVSSNPGPLPSPDQFFLNVEDRGQSFLNDYYQTLTKLNRVYLDTLSDWVHQTLDSQYSAQVVYNLPMEMAANIPSVDAPECESLGFNHLVDGYRQFAGPANLAGKRIISNEMGAVQLESYTQTLPELIWDVKRAFIGGVNRMVYHGFPFTGFYPNTSWPGFTTFYYQFSGMHGPRQPAWEYYDDYMDWTARMQYVAQSGIPKVDLAFYVHDEVTYSIYSMYNPTDLEERGFTYEYISPSNFGLDTAYVQDGILAPTRQSFKALIVRQNDTMTLPGVRKIQQWAGQGLPVVFSGGLPNTVAGHAAHRYLPTIRSILQQLVSMDNVYILPYDNLAASLASVVGVTPRTAIESDGNWWTYWRETEDTSYAILYNDAAGIEPSRVKSTGTVTFEAQGAPYLYDAWTGTTNAVLAYQTSKSGITIPFLLAGNQSIIVAFHHNESDAKAPLLSLPEGVSAYSTGTRNIELLANNASEPVVLQNGTAVQLPPASASTTLHGWDLIVESWSPSNVSENSNDPFASKLSNSSFTVSQPQPWTQISDSLRNISGRGFYNTTFTLNGQEDGAWIDLGYITMTARVWVNNHQMPPLDPTNPIADIGKVLVKGKNEVLIVVSTTLGNAVRGYWPNIVTVGTPAELTAPIPDEQEYGLLAPVKIVPYRRTIITIR